MHCVFIEPILITNSIPFLFVSSFSVGGASVSSHYGGARCELPVCSSVALAVPRPELRPWHEQSSVHRWSQRKWKEVHIISPAAVVCFFLLDLWVCLCALIFYSGLILFNTFLVLHSPSTHFSVQSSSWSPMSWFLLRVRCAATRVCASVCTTR